MARKRMISDDTCGRKRPRNVQESNMCSTFESSPATAHLSTIDQWDSETLQLPFRLKAPSSCDSSDEVCHIACETTIAKLATRQRQGLSLSISGEHSLTGVSTTSNFPPLSFSSSQTFDAVNKCYSGNAIEETSDSSLGSLWRNKHCELPAPDGQEGATAFQSHSKIDQASEAQPVPGCLSQRTAHKYAYKHLHHSAKDYFDEGLIDDDMLGVSLATDDWVPRCETGSIPADDACQLSSYTRGVNDQVTMCGSSSCDHGASFPRGQESTAQVCSKEVLEEIRSPSNRHIHYIPEFASESFASQVDKLSLNIPMSPLNRAEFPTLMRDRSPLKGATPTTHLKVCFRIGEALKYGAQAVRLGVDLFVQLYALVSFSEREALPSVKQNFILRDVWSKHGITLNATCENWRGNSLWETETADMLSPKLWQSGLLCRAVGQVVKLQQGWQFSILRIENVAFDSVSRSAQIVTGKKATVLP